jgi:tRNA nucleotidyltransferase (CCA-adding enzyme)
VARLAARFHGDIHRGAELRASTLLSVLERCDALRRPERFELVLLACEADYRGRLGWQTREYTVAAHWRRALAAVCAVDAGAIAKKVGAGETAAKRDDNGKTPVVAAIPQAIQQARISALAQLAG